MCGGGGGGGCGGAVTAVVAVVAVVVVAVVAPEFLPALATTIGEAAGLEGTAAMVAGSAVMGGATGAAAGTAQGGDAIWQGAVAGAVGGATGAGAGAGLGGGAAGAIGGGAAGGAASGATSAAVSGKDASTIGERALLGAGTGAVASGLTYGAAQLGSEIGSNIQAGSSGGYETADAAYNAQGEKVAEWNPDTGQYETASGQRYQPDTSGDYAKTGGTIGKEFGKLAGSYANKELFAQSPTYQSGEPTYSAGTTGGGYGGGSSGTGAAATGGGVDQVLYPQIGTSTGALAQALRSTPTGAVGGGGVEPSPGEGEQQNVWNVSSLKLKDALGA